MNPMSELPAVKVVEGCRPNDIPPEVLGSDEPVLLKGLVSEWPAVTTCKRSLPEAAQYLSRFWTNELVTVYVSEDNEGRFFYNDDFTGFNFRAGTAHFGQVMQKLAEHSGSDGQAIYMGSTNVDRWLPGFREENDVAMPSKDGLVSIWIGNRTRISAHYDFPDNIACVVAGERRFTLFPPEQIENLYVGPIDRTPSGQAISLVDFNNPDFEKFPRFAEALKHAQICDMEPGDAIFLPSMWWHHVESFSAYNILVNYWWNEASADTGSPFDVLLHALLVIRDMPPRQREAWRIMFDNYVFSQHGDPLAHLPPETHGTLGRHDARAKQQIRMMLLGLLSRQAGLRPPHSAR